MKYLIFSFLVLISTLFMTSCKEEEAACTELTWYEDADLDGSGNPDVSQLACEQPSGYVANNTDTDDTCMGIVDACGVCDGAGETIWYEDADGDGFGNPTVSLSACEQPEGHVANADDVSDDGSLNLNASFFNSSSLVSLTTVNCTLENGSSTTCYEMVFNSNPVENGPYCPVTINDIGGVGIYDGDTNPGFQVLKKSLWDAMEADGYDIVDENGNVTIVAPGAGGAGGPGGGGPPTDGGGGVTSACLEAAPDDNLVLTFLIPVVPELLSAPDVLASVENIGVSLDGIPLTGDPPSVTMSIGGMPGGGGAIPSIDPCGGHMDPSGYYHLHFAPQEMNNIYESYGITEVSCTNFPQSETALVGFAKDGFPIYASQDSDNTLPSDLDDCLGHIAVTAEFPNGTYHYHASNNLAPNIPPCLVGASVRNSFTFQ